MHAQIPIYDNVTYGTAKARPEPFVTICVATRFAGRKLDALARHLLFTYVVKVCLLIMIESQRNITVLDDNLEQRAEVVCALKNSHSVEILDSARTLLPHLKSSDVNLLVVSADLLESYCLSVVLDVIERWPGLPIVIVSSRTEQSEQVTDLYTNLSSAVVKLPFEANQLRDVIDTAMREKPFSTLDTP